MSLPAQTVPLPTRPSLKPLTSLASLASLDACAIDANAFPLPPSCISCTTAATTVSTAAAAHKPKVVRSYSVSSNASSVSALTVSSALSSGSTCSTSSRLAEDMLDRLASQEAHTTIDLWSAGNIRLNGRDLTMAAHDAQDLFHAMKEDERFVFVKLTFFDPEGEDWKISFHRSHNLVSPITSDSE